MSGGQSRGKNIIVHFSRLKLRLQLRLIVKPVCHQHEHLQLLFRLCKEVFPSLKYQLARNVASIQGSKKCTVLEYCIGVWDAHAKRYTHPRD